MPAVIIVSVDDHVPLHLFLIIVFSTFCHICIMKALCHSLCHHFSWVRTLNFSKKKAVRLQHL